MPHYFFHIREGATLTRDSTGQEFPDAEAARKEAIALGRALSGERPGRVRRSIEIVDQTGRVVDEIRTRDFLMPHTYSGASKSAPEYSPRR